MSERQPEMHERRILGTELLWSFGVGVLIAATLSISVFTALTMGKCTTIVRAAAPIRS